MTVMIDRDVRANINNNTSCKLFFGIKLHELEKQVHGCAVELRIGEIYTPGSEETVLGGISRPRSQLCLEEGQTAVIRTLETLQMDDRHAAIVFPVNRLSLEGLLMTNPGHVDPGYKGHLHVTVINMSKKAFPLEKGENLLRALVLKLDDVVDAPYLKTNSPITPELLDRLSPDFLSIKRRAQEAVKSEINKAERVARALGFFAPIVAAIIAYLASVLTMNAKISERIASLENRYDYEKRIDDLESKLSKFASPEERERAIK